MRVGDLIRITNEGAHNIDEVGINAGSKGIIVATVHPSDAIEFEWLYTVVVNNRRIPYLYDCEIKKFE